MIKSRRWQSPLCDFERSKLWVLQRQSFFEPSWVVSISDHTRRDVNGYIKKSESIKINGSFLLLYSILHSWTWCCGIVLFLCTELKVDISFLFWFHWKVFILKMGKVSDKAITKPQFQRIFSILVSVWCHRGGHVRHRSPPTQTHLLFTLRGSLSA